MAASKPLRFGRCPLKFVKVANNADVMRDFVGYQEVDGLALSEPEGWALCGRYAEDGWADGVYNMELRHDDAWIMSFPKSGTTWTQHMMWLLMNPDKIHTNERVDLRSPFVELDSLTPVKKFIKIMSEKREAELKKENPDREFLDVLNSEIDYLCRTRLDDAAAISTNERRLIKTHNPFSLLPPDVLDKTKSVYVARDPRDVLVSYFHHHRLICHHEFVGTFEEFFNYFINDQVLWAPYWKHIAQAWKYRDHPNMKFIFFNDMKKDLPGVLDELEAFLLDKPLSADQKTSILKELSIDAMKKNEATNDTELMIRLGMFKSGEGEFVRKGRQGGWRAYVEGDMLARLEEWKEKSVKEIGIENLPPLEKLWPQ